MNARNEHGLTPLHWATQLTDNPAIIEALLEAGAEVDARDEGGATPLHWAACCLDLAQEQQPLAILTLLEAGADASARDADGKTPWDLIQDNEALRGTDAY